MKITLKWLKENNACPGGIDWFKEQSAYDPVLVLKALIADKKLDWANWTIVRVMAKPQYLAYAIYAAEQVIDIFEKQYPEDNRPRKAIEAAKAVLNNDSLETREVASTACGAAQAAVGAVWGVWGAGGVGAAQAAVEAAWAAWAAGKAGAARAAQAVVEAACAAWAAQAVVGAAGKTYAAMQKKILDYGIGLLDGK